MARSPCRNRERCGIVVPLFFSNFLVVQQEFQQQGECRGTLLLQGGSNAITRWRHLIPPFDPAIAQTIEAVYHKERLGIIDIIAINASPYT